MNAVWDLLLSWLSPNGIIAAGVLYSIWKMILITREARAARIVNIAAAREAVEHAKATAAAVVGIADNMAKLEENTNHKMDLLLAAKDETARAQSSEADAAGEKRGIDIGRAERLKP